MANKVLDKGNILIVDDEQGILSSLEDILNDEGYRVVKASSGERALDLARAETPDVVLVDVWMPGIDGIKTLQAVKDLGIDTEVVVMSGHGNIETAVAATKLGAFDFIEKPLSMEAVLRVVGAAIKARKNRERNEAQRATLFVDSDDTQIASVRAHLYEAASDLRPLVLTSERGAGKRYAAQAIHARGVTREGSFTVVHARSFGGAEKKGGFKAAARRLLPDAAGGTIYLDGIEQNGAKTASLLLEILAAERGGDRLVVSIDLPPGVEKDPFADECAGQLGARLIHLPPLRERRGDILPLARRFLEEATAGGPEKEFGEDAIGLMNHYDWPINVAELKSVVTRAVFSTSDKVIHAEHMPASMRGETSQETVIEAPADYRTARRDWERRFLAYHLVRNNWDVEETSRSIGMPQATLSRKLKTYRLSRPEATERAPGAVRQRTIARSIVLYGRGLHSGLKTGLILEPLPPDSGIRFGNLTNPDTVAARVEYVDNTNYSTNLRKGPIVARTIEHLMSVLHAYGITNLLVKMGEEVPIMDGSAIDFCQHIEEAEIIEQDATLAPLVVEKPYEIGEPGSTDGYIRVEPDDAFSVSFLLDYPEPIGLQKFKYVYEGVESFRTEVAPARTFNFISALESLEQMGLGEGGRWGNVILVDDERVVNTELRFPDEFVRHKVLDLFGDFYLLGRPIRGRVTAERSGHRLNVEMVRLLANNHS